MNKRNSCEEYFPSCVFSFDAWRKSGSDNPVDYLLSVNYSDTWFVMARVRLAHSLQKQISGLKND